MSETTGQLELAPEQAGEQAATAEAKPAEVIKLELVVKESGVELSTAQGLIESFAPIFREVHDLLERAKEAPEVTDATQLTEMEACRRLRLALVRQRTSGDKLRERLKKDSQLRGNAIQGAFNILRAMTEPAEDALEEREKFAERAEAARITALADERKKALAEYEVDTTFVDLGRMPVAVFDRMLAGAKAAKEAEVAAAEKAKEEKAARELADKLRQSRLVEIVPVMRFLASPLPDLGTIDKAAFDKLLEGGTIAKIEDDKARENQRVENARLLKEAEVTRLRLQKEEKEREIERQRVETAAQAERERVAAERKAAIEKAAAERMEFERKAREEREAFEAKAKAEREQVRKEQEAAAAKARAELEAEQAKARAAAEEARKEREAIEAKAKAEKDALEAKAEAERDTQRQERLKEQAAREVERQKIEAERQKEREAVARAEQVARDIAAEERREREKAEARLAARKKADDDAEKARQAAERKAASAPDKAKLLALANTFDRALDGDGMKMTTEAGKASRAEIEVALEALIALIWRRAEAL